MKNTHMHGVKDEHIQTYTVYFGIAMSSVLRRNCCKCFLNTSSF